MRSRAIEFQHGLAILPDGERVMNSSNHVSGRVYISWSNVGLLTRRNGVIGKQEVVKQALDFQTSNANVVKRLRRRRHAGV